MTVILYIFILISAPASNETRMLQEQNVFMPREIFSILFFIPFCYDIFSLLHCKTIVFYLLKSLCTLFHSFFAREKIAICILTFCMRQVMLHAPLYRLESQCGFFTTPVDKMHPIKSIKCILLVIQNSLKCTVPSMMSMKLSQLNTYRNIIYFTNLRKYVQYRGTGI